MVCRETISIYQDGRAMDATVPKNIMYEIPEIDRRSGNLLLSQLRKEFIADKTYDGTMITLIRHLRCNQEPNFIECKK